jgi:hypothetical protein
MEIRKHTYPGQRGELSPGPFDGIARRSVNFELPVPGIHGWRPARIQNRPFFCARLTGWNTLQPPRIGTHNRPGRRIGGAGDFVRLFFTFVHPEAHARYPFSTGQISFIIGWKCFQNPKHHARFPIYAFLYPVG